MDAHQTIFPPASIRVTAESDVPIDARLVGKMDPSELYNSKGPVVYDIERYESPAYTVCPVLPTVVFVNFVTHEPYTAV
jgi:hypothetical protein